MFLFPLGGSIARVIYDPGSPADQVVALRQQLSRAASPLQGRASDLDSLLQRLGDADYVLLGEATHGTDEFYRARSEITKRLVTEHGFTLVAWEADWPDALRVNRYIQGTSGDHTAWQSLDGFKRFPTWMWRNLVIVELVEWLRDFNRGLAPAQRNVGVFGLDLYSLHTSMAAVISYLEKVNPAAAAEARQRYACFEHFGDDPQSYGMNAAMSHSLSCEQEVVQQLVELQRRSGEFLQRDGQIAEDELFYAEQNALVARDAEKYYRAMYRGRPNTWNLRDRHMVDALDRLVEHVRGQNHPAKAIVWAHNSHIGDARATQMARRNEVNVGQLIRERHGDRAVLVGFTTHTGTVTAASDWGGATERKHVRASMEGSFELLFHQCDAGDFLLSFRDHPQLRDPLNCGKLERAIGVVYLPEVERYSHYFSADLANQFDFVIHYDTTHAIEPLERTSEWEKGELPETFPSGL